MRRACCVHRAVSGGCGVRASKQARKRASEPSVGACVRASVLYISSFLTSDGLLVCCSKLSVCDADNAAFLKIKNRIETALRPEHGFECGCRSQP